MTTTILRCEDCRMGLLHWHCPACGRAVDEYGARCWACCRAADHWKGLAALLAAVASWAAALTALHSYLSP